MARIALEFVDTNVFLRRIGNPAAPSVDAISRTGILNLFEAVHDLLLRRHEVAAARVFDVIHQIAEPLTRTRIFEASRLRVKHKHRALSYADAAGYVRARELGALFLTTDRGFKGLPGVRLFPLAEGPRPAAR